jgi:hypothetical protein
MRAEDFIRSIPSDGPVLEIGPFNRPRLTGAHVRYFDIVDQAAINARAAFKGLPETAPPIDHVSPDGDLSTVPGPLAGILSAHCIEHQLDLVGHLQAAERLLEPGRGYHLIIPDKRYCFDHFLAESTIADVLDAHLHPRSKHATRAVIEHLALTTHNNARRHWLGDHGRPGTNAERIKGALGAVHKGVDAHAWRFTPTSFRQILALLRDVGLIGLEPEAVHRTPWGRGEFCAVLRKPL